MCIYHADTTNYRNQLHQNEIIDCLIMIITHFPLELRFECNSWDDGCSGLAWKIQVGIVVYDANFIPSIESPPVYQWILSIESMNFFLMDSHSQSDMSLWEASNGWKIAKGATWWVYCSVFGMVLVRFDNKLVNDKIQANGKCAKIVWNWTSKGLPHERREKAD